MCSLASALKLFPRCTASNCSPFVVLFLFEHYARYLYDDIIVCSHHKLSLPPHNSVMLCTPSVHKVCSLICGSTAYIYIHNFCGNVCSSRHHHRTPSSPCHRRQRGNGSRSTLDGHQMAAETLQRISHEWAPCGARERCLSVDVVLVCALHRRQHVNQILI